MRLIDKFFDNKTKTEVTYYGGGNKETEIHYKNGKKVHIPVKLNTYSGSR